MTQIGAFALALLLCNHVRNRSLTDLYTRICEEHILGRMNTHTSSSNATSASPFFPLYLSTLPSLLPLLYQPSPPCKLYMIFFNSNQIGRLFEFVMHAGFRQVSQIVLLAPVRRTDTLIFKVKNQIYSAFI